MNSKQNARQPVVLTVAGSDSGGGAGVQADLKTFAALGCYGVTAFTALTAQNSLGVSSVHEVPVPFIRDQLRAVMTDMKPRFGKTGMLATSGIIEAVAEEFAVSPLDGLVVDPVMISTTGHRLINESAVETLVRRLFPAAALVTPNLHEASALLGREVGSLEEMERAAREIRNMGPAAVLVKGGHLDGEAADCYYDGVDVVVLAGERIDTIHTHGSGCVLSAAITAFLAQGMPMAEAVSRGKSFITAAVRDAFPVGGGPGPVNPLADWKS